MMDINCDMGEVDELLKNNTYSKLMDHVTSINVACGGHAGDMNMMRKIIQIAKNKNVKIIASSVDINTKLLEKLDNF